MRRIYIGTSGFSYPEWSGVFYPLDVKTGEMLSYYAEQFNAVEINHTFYRLPSEKMLDGWVKGAGPEFKFALKARRLLTHGKNEIQEGYLRLFMDRITRLGNNLGPVLYQFPPSCGESKQILAIMEVVQKVALENFRDIPAVVEVRNPGLLNRSFYHILRRLGLHLCLNDAYLPFREWPEPFDIVYLRLRNGPYEQDFLQQIGKRVREWAKSGINCFLFFKHEITAPGLAQQMKELILHQSVGEMVNV